MKTQVLFYEFDTKSKPGKIIVHGIRFESQEITEDMLDVKLPLLCQKSVPEVQKQQIRNLINSLVDNF